MSAHRLFAAALATGIAWAHADEGALASGHLETGGGYLISAPGSTVSMLPDGSVLSYGFGPAVDERLAQREQTAALRGRRKAPRIATPDPAPRLWRPDARGWHTLPSPPECRAFLRYLHTATVLQDGRVLVAGGLCDEAKMADDPSPHAAHAKVSIWDPGARRWTDGPALREARIHHTATLMPDGGVVIAGGENDPALSDVPEPVISAVERFKDNAIEPGPPLMQARARHTATLLPDGALLVAGGFDGTGRAIASVEILQRGATAWRALPPLREARHSHTATALGDGRVLVAGGKDAQDRALASTEIWDPARGEWLSGPALPVALNAHAAARLANGEVLIAGGAWIGSPLAPMPWAWTWSPATADWKVAGHAMPRDDTDLAGGVTLVPRADNTATIFTPRAILRWVPGPAREAPLWDSLPSIAPLKGARALVVAREVGDTQSAIARVWDAARDRWTFAGRPGGRETMDSATAELPSGTVIHVGVNMENTLVCHAWQPPDAWSDCGSLRMQYLKRGRPRIGALPDGRAFVIVNEHEAAFFDEGARQWTATRLEWNRDGFAFGAPVRHDKPFARIADPASGAWLEIDDTGARYYNSSLAGGNASMLWDPRASRWAYVFIGRRMGANAQWLPDGCAISTDPLHLFDPRESEPRKLSDPGLGIEPHQGAMAVLDDGTVVMAGVSAAAKDPGAGFFHRKATCAGFVAQPRDAVYIAPDPAGMLPTPPPRPAPQAAPQPAGFPHWVERAKAQAYERRWLLLAILAPLTLYLLLRRTRVGRARAPASRGLRIVIYVIVAILILPFAAQYAIFHLATSARDCVESRVRCEADPPWWIALARRAKPAEPPPCNLVGVWSAQRRQAVRHIELKDDGTYEMPRSRGDNHRYTGRWRVEGDKMVWQHDQAPGERDVNPMENLSDTRFTLTEMNGQVTNYDLVRRVPSKKCTP